MSVSIDLTGKSAIVTGGGDGIGRETARTLAQAGANVMIADLNADAAEQAAEELSREYGVKSWFIKCDVACAQDVQKLTQTAVREMDGSTFSITSRGSPGKSIFWRWMKTFST